jgi:uncharacterized protein YndB with AHSA1/START domain
MNATTEVAFDSGLPAQSPYERSIVLTRVFDCPRALMWKMWTDPVHMAQWFGPEHFTNDKVKVDLRVGGGFELAMISPTKSEHPMRAEYREIVPNQKLAFTNNAYDSDGKQLLEGYTTVTFEDVAGKTKVTLETTAKGVAEVTKFMLGGMKDGWAQSWDKLAAYLKKH